MADLNQASEPDQIDQALNRIIAVKAAQKSLDDELALLQDSISSLVDRAELDAAFTFNDWSFSYSSGRAKWSYPKAVEQIDSQLKAAKKTAESDGTATKSIGAPYWIIRSPKP
jgi:hypothetical protein